MTDASLLGRQFIAREEIHRRLVEDLRGPSAPDEVIPDPPITRYVTGILYPESDEPIATGADAELDEDYDETTAPEPTVAMANARFPTTMGITFAVSTDTDRLDISLTAARYEKELTVDDEDRDEDADEAEEEEADDTREVWRRVPLQLETETIAIRPGVEKRPVASGLELFVRVRTADRTGAHAVTVALRNLQQASGMRDEYSFFQPSISVKSGGAGVFRERTGSHTESSDRDLRSYRLLYREARNFATGHGCSAQWDSDGDRASEIRTTFVPSQEVSVAESNPALELPVLRMVELAEGDREQVLDGLEDLADRYSRWIGERRAEVLPALTEELRDIGSEHLDECDLAAGRILAGVQLLREDSDVWTGFRLMNRAMLNQRARAVWLAEGGSGDGPRPDDSHRWRAFQLAFILLCLSGIAEDSTERRIVDLLWFPTGGGKTEAYLGLIAFTLFLRRLREESTGAGVTVIMRYTLRLLTLQQFERAALLICACEQIRREEAVLGDAEIAIGLWVGEAATPNSLADTRNALDRLSRGEELEEGNPIQLRRCPWCGTGLSRSNYFIGDRREQLIISCRQEDCDFSARLPVYLIDEDLYAERPALIIATADKFASLPWNDKVGRLFNLGTPDPAPELIIQDELHLISGPLGTLAGLYETAIDILCDEAGSRPKIVASTATIRRAHNQGRALFGREIRQFPPAALDQGDSWFAVEAPRERRGPRLYLGAMAPGTSQATLLVRAYAVLLQAAADLDVAPEVKDPYWTLVGYFNSLRVLGGARMQVQDDVRDRLGVLAGKGARPMDSEIIELTSREPSSRIPHHLQDMSVSIPDERAIDVILATNMISVGVDIDRLGLMVVMGQPQATAEYIQATSRVGRTHPGLILVLFNSARSRDRSHYESFDSYHSALYRQVESTSVTPFSSRARERGLHAVLVSLCRLLEPAFAGNDGAAAAADGQPALEGMRDRILRRVEQVDPVEYENTRRQLDDLIEMWVERARQQPDLLYNHPRDRDRALLVSAAELDAETDELPTLYSLRDVDQETEILLVR